MSVCCDGHPLRGCDRAESDLCRAFAQTFVRLAAGVIVGAKPLSLFLFRPEADVPPARVRELFRTYARSLSAYGVTLQVVGSVSGRYTLIAYRGRLVAEVVADESNAGFLADAGYDVSCASALMSQFRARLAAYYGARAAGEAHARFPHEMGLVFGYPLEDVVGYINDGDMTCHGSWRAYGEERVARRRFRLLAEREGGCRVRFASGEPLSALFPAAG